jgi:dihydroorotate dehydrogenase
VDNFSPSALYQIDKSYLENAEEGPFFKGELPRRSPPSQSEWHDFLGFRVASRLGVAAGPLLNARWIALAAQLGFDLLCYKTIRSRAHPSHPLPNIVFLESDGQFSQDELPTSITSCAHPLPPERLAITNSFGNPSRSPHYLRRDIPLAQNVLYPGQALIVSVFGTPGNDPKDFLEDFAKTACFAKECGAKIIEANFSCPNVSQHEGSLYCNPEAVYTFALRIVQAIGDTPLIIKMGAFPHLGCMKECLLAAARAGARAIAGINTVSMNIINPQGEPALGDDRKTSGVCGAPIRKIALDFVQEARDIINREKLSLTLCGGGGITLPEHFDLFFEAGADFAFTAAGMMWDPYLALNYHLRESYARTAHL